MTLPAASSQAPRLFQVAGAGAFLVFCAWVAGQGAPGKKSAAAGVPLPVYFEANRGQADQAVEYIARGGGRAILLRRDGAVLPGGVRMSFAGARPEARVEGERELLHRSHYLIGGDARRWLRDVPHFGKVRYRNLYAGVDLVFYEGGGGLEYDFELAPGTDARSIRLRFEGADGLRVDPGGALLVSVKGGGEIRQSRPKMYRKGWGRREQVAGRYVVLGPEEVGFEVEGSGNGWGLLIDPELSFSSFLGGAGADIVYGLAVDAAGNSYVTGVTGSAGLGEGVEGRKIQVGGPSDAFVAKLTPAGALEWVTYVGGGGLFAGVGNDDGRAVQVDAQGNVWVAGRTNSSNFPVTKGSMQEVSGGGWDGFLLKLDPTGSKLLYSTYVGGSSADEVYGLAVSPSGEAFLTGWTQSNDSFPVTQRAAQRSSGGNWDAFAVKIDRNGALVYSTYIGGYWSDQGQDIAVDRDGNAIVTGWTNSADFPVKDALQTLHGGFFAARTADAGASWTGVQFPVKARVSSFAIDPVNPRTIYAGTTAGVLRSDDGGTKWTLANSGLRSYQATCLAVDPKTPATIYACTNGGGVFRSSDRGGQWKQINNGIGEWWINSIVIDPGNTLQLYLAIGGMGVYESTDGGEKWNELRQFGIAYLAMDPRTPATLYASIHPSGIQRSTDGGRNWTNFAGSTGIMYPSAIAVDAANPNLLYVASDVVYRSIDGGQTWNRTSKPCGSHTVVADPKTPNAVYATGCGLYKSTNGGETWQKTESGFDGGDPYLIAIDRSNPATLYLGINPATDAFVAKLNPAGDLVFSTYLGGLAQEEGRAVATDERGNIHISGMTASKGFPVTSDAFQNALSGGADFFLTRLDPSGRNLLYSSFFGGPNWDEGTDLKLTPRGEIVVLGWGGSGLFTTPDAIQRGHRGWDDIIVGVFSADGRRLMYCTYFGGNGQEKSSRLGTDAFGGVTIAGWTGSDNFPVLRAAQPARAGGTDGFIARIAEVLEPAELSFSAANALTGAVAGAEFQSALSILGGRPPYRWAVDSGALPSGVLLNPVTGVLAGTPTTPGSFAFRVRVTDRTGLSIWERFTLVVAAPARLTITSPAKLPDGGVGTAYAQDLMAAGGATPYRWDAAAGSLPAGLELDPATGRLSGSPKQAGSFVFRARVGDSAGAVHTKDLSLAVGSAVSVSGVVSAASLLSGPVAPGKAVVVLGSGLGPSERVSFELAEGQLTSTLSDTQVLVDNMPAPLLDVQAGRITAMIPFAVEGTLEARLQVIRKGSPSNSVRLQIAPSAPDLFTRDSSGKGQALALNEDRGVNSVANPAERGKLVTVFGTGAGPTDPQVADGQIAVEASLPCPRQAVKAMAGGVEAEITEVVSVRGMVVGLFQATMRIPETAPSGGAVAIVLKVGGASSQPGVSIAIR